MSTKSFSKSWFLNLGSTDSEEKTVRERVGGALYPMPCYTVACLAASLASQVDRGTFFPRQASQNASRHCLMSSQLQISPDGDCLGEEGVVYPLGIDEQAWRGLFLREGTQRVIPTAHFSTHISEDVPVLKGLSV